MTSQGRWGPIAVDEVDDPNLTPVHFVPNLPLWGTHDKPGQVGTDCGG